MIERWRFGVCAALLLLSQTSCMEDGPEAPRVNCGVIVDSTGFAGYPTAKDLIKQNLSTFARGCGWVAFAAITGRSMGTPCQRPSLLLVATKQENPKDNPKVARQIRERRLAEVSDHAFYLLEKCKDGAPGSDVLGGFRVIANLLQSAPDRSRPSKIIVFSDLMNNVGALQLQRGDYSSDAAVQAKVRMLREANLLPVLSGAPTITVHGFNLLSEQQGDRVSQLEHIWRAIFAVGGAGRVNLL